MKIGILFNCQHESLAIALRALLPSAQVIRFRTGPRRRFDESQRSRIETALAGCDHVVTQDVASGYGPLGTAALRARVRRLHLLPAFRFAGFHPDFRQPHVGWRQSGWRHRRLSFAHRGSRLSGRAFAARHRGSVQPAQFRGALGYLHRFAEQHALLLENYAALPHRFERAVQGLDARRLFHA